jgi:hypothetical protein
VQVDFDITLCSTTARDQHAEPGRAAALLLLRRPDQRHRRVVSVTERQRELVARQGTPLPTLADFDYGSFNPGASDETIFVFTNSNPVAEPRSLVLGVFNSDVAP